MGYIISNETQIAAKVMDGEAILINLTTGIYYSLDDLASELWPAIGEGTSEEALSDWIVSVYGVDETQARSDVAEFVKALRSEEIVVDTTEGLATPASGNASYAAPTFERFDDMAEMFALDPPLPGLAAKA